MSQHLERAPAPGGAAEGRSEPAAGTAERERPWWALRPAQLLLVGLGGLWFLLVGYLPLGGGAVLGHVSFGEWILEHRSIPAEDPFLPLADGMPIVDREWLSQVVLALAHRAGGARALAALFALSSLATVLLWGSTFARRTGGLLWGAVGVAVALALAWGPATTFGPHSFGILCFALLLWLVFGAGGPEAEPLRGRGRWIWGAVPVLFVLWANLDESFVHGLAVLLAAFLGRVAAVVREERSLRAALADRAARRWLYLAELAAAATLLNPYGLRLLASVLWLPESETVRSLAENQPLALAGLAGRAFALSVLVLLVALRFGRRRVPAAEVLLLLWFGWGVLSARGMLTWYAPVFSLAVVPLVTELAGRAGSVFARRPDRDRAGALRRRLAALAGPSWHYSLLAFVALWAAFALSPLGGAVLGRAPQPAEQTVGGAPPAALVEYLRSAPPEGQVFNPGAWGDWLIREGPPGLEVFAASQAHHLPPQVWRDYLRVTGGAASWDAVLDRYGIDTVILDRTAQRGPVQSLRYDAGWRLAHEDPRSAVFVRAAVASAPAADEVPVPD